MSQLLDGLRAFADTRETSSKVPLCASALIDLAQIRDREQTKNGIAGLHLRPTKGTLGSVSG